SNASKTNKLTTNCRETVTWILISSCLTKTAGRTSESRPTVTKIPLRDTISHSSQSRFSSAANCWVTAEKTSCDFPSLVIPQPNTCQCKGKGIGTVRYRSSCTINGGPP